MGPASCLVETTTLVRPDLRDGLREISSMHVDPEHRGEGWGRQLMDALTLEADANSVVLFVAVDPFDDGPLDAASLRAWYERNGFHEFQAEPLLMARMPNDGRHQ